MKKIYTVALVGRPNVGKSTLFNRIVGKRVSIVEDTPGVTRDRIMEDAEWCGKDFTLIDTGGLETSSEDVMWNHIRSQVELAMDAADVIVFITDCKQGVMGDDYDICSLLRRSGKKVLLAVNKCDNNEDVSEFWTLGIGEPIAVSGEQAKGIGDLLDEIVKDFDTCEEEESDLYINIAVVGKPNAGKSSLVNKLLGYDRTIVSDIAGTTRDAVNAPFTYNGTLYNIIDTAGMRKKANVDGALESYSVMRSIGSIRKADVAVIVIDAASGISEQDVRICGLVHEQGKASVIVMNKWDLIEKDTFTVNEFNKKLSEALKFMDYFKPIYISALNGKRVNKVMDMVEEVYKNAKTRISTGVLNDVVREAVMVNEPPSYKGRKLKIYYATQVSVAPPTFVLFVNDDKLMHFSYERYLENYFRKSFILDGTPIKILLRNKSEKEQF